MNDQEKITIREMLGKIIECFDQIEEKEAELQLIEETKAITENIVVAGLLPLKEVEKIIILNRLKHFEGNRERTAESLGIGVRTLYRYLRRWGM